MKPIFKTALIVALYNILAMGVPLGAGLAINWLMVIFANVYLLALMGLFWYISEGDDK